MNESTVRTEEYVVSGEKLVTTIKELLHESNIRRISLKDEQGKTLIEIPLTLGVIGALLIPTWAAVGAIAALVAHLRIVVEKDEDATRNGKVLEAPMPAAEPSSKDSDPDAFIE